MKHDEVIQHEKIFLSRLLLEFLVHPFSYSEHLLWHVKLLLIRSFMHTVVV